MTAPVVVVAEQLRRRVPGGIGRYAAWLLRGLRRPEVGAPPVELFVSRRRGTGPDPLEAYGFPVHRAWLPAPWLVAAWDRGMLAAPRTASVVHAVSLAAPPVRPARRAGGAALVVTVYDLAWRSHPEATTARGRRWHEAALGRALRAADAFVVPSEPSAAELVAAGAPCAQVRVIPPGLDHLPAPDAAGARALLRGLGVDGPYLLAVGTLEPRKNLERLAAAHALATPSLPGPWPLVVVGPVGWGGRPAAFAVGSHPGKERRDGLVVAGSVDDGVLAGLYAGARAFAYVPVAEGFGLPPLEAMTHGVPVVVSAAVPSTAPAPGAVPAALRVEATSVEDIAAALVRASTDEEVRSQLVERAAALVEPMTWTRAARAHVALWRELS